MTIERPRRVHQAACRDENDAIVKDDDGNNVMLGCDPFVVRVDTAGPELDATQTFTGVWLDGDDEKSGADAKRTSVRVAFSEKLDCDSVSADDFEVGGATPNDATCDGKYVYLDVDELGANAKTRGGSDR